MTPTRPPFVQHPRPRSPQTHPPLRPLPLGLRSRPVRNEHHLGDPERQDRRGHWAGERADGRARGVAQGRGGGSRAGQDAPNRRARRAGLLLLLLHPVRVQATTPLRRTPVFGPASCALELPAPDALRPSSDPDHALTAATSPTTRSSPTTPPRSKPSCAP